MTEKETQLANAKRLECSRAYKKRWREKNKEHLREYHRKWREENRERLKEYQMRYWLKRALEEGLSES